MENSRMSSTVAQPLVFEQPLNERMRLFLRFEGLLDRFDSASGSRTEWSAHCAISALIELHNLVNRVDIKRDLLKEIERIIASLSRHASDPLVDDDMLDRIISRLRKAFDTLQALEGQPDQHLVENDFFGSIRQRIAIPGGTCGFDLPAYHHWLHGDPEARHQLLDAWITPFRRVGDAVDVLLDLIRTSMAPRTQRAEGGYFEKALDPSSLPWQMIRVEMEAGSSCFPEISAGKHRFTIRFLDSSDPGSRPRQCKGDTTFLLTCCAL